MMSTKEIDEKLEAFAETLISDGDISPILDYIPYDIKREIIESLDEVE